MNCRLIRPTIRCRASHYSRPCPPRLASPSSPRPRSRYFSTTRWRSDSIVNHYEVLQVAPDCSQAELKKQFYTLSRLTHPDVNKSDPEASTRFSQISESYSTLADPDRRKHYDRNVFRVHHQRGQHRHRNTGGRGSGSYAGSRPATGLSQRRGTFRGPPPSFYTHGGRGHDKPPTNNSNNNNNNKSNNNRATSFSGRAGSDPNFNPDPIERTQSHEDVRRHTRREAAMLAAQRQAEDDEGFWVRFFVVSALLIGGLSVGGILLGAGGGQVGKGGLLRGDGTRRDGSGSGGGSGYTATINANTREARG